MAKAPLPCTSSKTNLAKPPKAPKHSPSKEAQCTPKQSTSTSQVVASIIDNVMTDSNQEVTDLTMEETDLNPLASPNTSIYEAAPAFSLSAAQHWLPPTT